MLRLGIASLALVQLVTIWPWLRQLYGPYGFIQWAIVEAGEETWLPTIGKVAMFLGPFGISADACLHGVFVCYGVAVMGLLLGLFTRTSALVAWLLHSLTIHSGYLSLYGFDTMLHIALFYAVVMPVGAALSLDARRRGHPPSPTFGANLSLRLLQLHLCIIYLNTGLAKLAGAQWRSGDAIWQALMQPQFATFDMSWMAEAPWVTTVAAWGTMIVETGYAIFVWWRRTRVPWIVAIIGLHLGIALFMGLWLFSSIMILFNVCAFLLADNLPGTRRSVQACRCEVPRDPSLRSEIVTAQTCTRLL